MKIVQQEDEKILLKQNILLKEYQSRPAMTTLRKENPSRSEPIQKPKLGRRWRSRSPPQRRWRSRSPPQRRFQISNNSNNNAVTLSTKNHVASILVQRIGNTSQLTSEQLFQATAEALTGIVSVSNFNTALQTAAINSQNLPQNEVMDEIWHFDHWTRAENPFLRR